MPKVGFLAVLNAINGEEDDSHQLRELKRVFLTPDEFEDHIAVKAMEFIHESDEETAKLFVAVLRGALAKVYPPKKRKQQAD